MADRIGLSVDSLDADLDADEALGPLLLELHIQDAELITALIAYPEGPAREEFATSALRIGVLALGQARGQLDSGLIQRECKSMLGMLEKQLADHATQLNTRLTGSLQEYFDPQTGRFQERVDRLIKRDGELEQVLRRQLGADDSELCKTLLAHFGASSPLMKVLSPTESQGLMNTLREAIAGQLTEQREKVLREFSLSNQESALSCMLRQLTDSNGRLTTNLQGRIDDMAKQFSLHDENSALSRFKKTIEAAEKAIHDNLTLDDKNSSLSRLKGEMLELLNVQAKNDQRFQEEVKMTLAAMVAKKAEAARSTQHGIEFEAVAFEFLDRLAQQAGDVAEATGDTTGLIKNCKIGDCVLTLGQETAAPGARIVIEAKEKQKYDLKAALEEIDQARKNRDAQVGVFLFSKKTAPAGLEPLARYGNDVVAIWDAEDNQTDLCFRSALTLAKALCIRAVNQRAAQAADFTAIDTAILEITKQSANLDTINGWAETIYKRGTDIIDHVRKARAALERQVKVLQDNLADLKNTLQAPTDSAS